ncbi:MAG TPA: hypothetical protein VJP02_13495 [Candidatus Sulfotelmatobacter sp.]|nr:hypothetical protein [Candidatus Sulfotelmatobacter sp.]
MCTSMAVILPVSLAADETAAAILRSSGSGVLVNKSPAPTSIALFPDDLVETPKNAVARIEVSGSTADINSDTVVQFEGDELVLDHGSLSVSTTKGLRVRVGCLTVTPVNVSQRTQYEVLDVDGKVTVNATKSDVYIDSRAKKAQEAKNPSRSTRDIVREGEQKSREEKCGAPYMRGDNVAGLGALMNSMWAKIVAGGAVGAVACLGLCPDDDPASPSKP